jgi:hypothetical protein
MLQRFLATHPLTDGPEIAEAPEPTPAAFRRAAGGRTFSSGLYRTHTEQSASRLADHISAAFPEAPPHEAPYGYDWLGRQFCARTDDVTASTLMFEPGTGEVLEIPVPFSDIHDEELVDHAEAALARDFFGRYLASGGSVPRLDECVGYRTPLFLGGVDDEANLELSDLSVYWHLMGPLIRGAKGLAPGTSIGSISIE